MHKARVKDLARKRREYLWKKADAFMIMGLAICVLIMAPLSFVAVVKPPADSHLPPIVGGLIAAGTLAALGLGVFIMTFNNAKAIPHVPPVSEQIEALPAGEILVRGSEKPSADSRELLKAASVNTEIAKTELLRAETRIAE